MTESTAIRSRWTALGLGISFLGIPAVTQAYRALAGTSVEVAPLLLREGAIFALLGGLLFIVLRLERLPLSSIGLGRRGIGGTLLWSLLLFALLAAGIALALGLLHVLGLHYGGDHAAAAPPLWITAFVVLRAAIVEEVFYRGYAIERIQSLTGSRGIAAIIPLIAFALFHYRQGIAGIIIAAILGGILTAFYFWRRNLAANIAGHFMVDFIPNVLLPALGA
jgi:membrane protease YdiL (CAAX protease family)